MRVVTFVYPNKGSPDISVKWNKHFIPFKVQTWHDCFEWYLISVYSSKVEIYRFNGKCLSLTYDFSRHSNKLTIILNSYEEYMLLLLFLYFLLVWRNCSSGPSLAVRQIYLWYNLVFLFYLYSLSYILPYTPENNNNNKKNKL